jgi:hypothetical protein
MAPKTEKEGSRRVQYHAKEKILGPSNSQWVFEEIDVSHRATNMLLVRIAIAKIVKVERVREILRATPIRQGETGWNCVGWVKEALQLLDTDGEVPLGTRVIEWVKVRDAAMSYCNAKKAAHRFDGKAEGAAFDIERPPTFDLTTNRETVP